MKKGIFKHMLYPNKRKIRYYDEKEKNVREKFMGFVKYEKMDAQTIAAEINEYTQD